MTNPTTIEHNVTTGEIIERELTQEELVAYQENQQRLSDASLAETQKATDRQVLLARLGITAEEAQLLLG